MLLLAAMMRLPGWIMMGAGLSVFGLDLYHWYVTSRTLPMIPTSVYEVLGALLTRGDGATTSTIARALVGCSQVLPLSLALFAVGWVFDLLVWHVTADIRQPRKAWERRLERALVREHSKAQ